jgi:hypothetical protein
MSKTDDVLLELNRGVAAYLRSISPFRYKKQRYRLIDNYVATPTMRCDVCGGYPEWEISIIESDDGHTLHLGNVCIDRLTEQDISGWMKEFRKKRENIMANRKCIDQLTKILEAYTQRASSVQVTEEGAKKIRKLLEQIVKGENLTVKQQETAEAYLTLTVTA